MADWKTFLEEGKKYHRTAQGSVRRPEVFTPAITQGIAAMGIEKYTMAICMRTGILPRNHTMADLLAELDTLVAIPPDVRETLHYMDSLQRICSLDTFSIRDPSAQDVPRFLAALDALAELAGSIAHETDTRT